MSRIEKCLCSFDIRDGVMLVKVRSGLHGLVSSFRFVGESTGRVTFEIPECPTMISDSSDPEPSASPPAPTAEAKQEETPQPRKKRKYTKRTKTEAKAEEEAVESELNKIETFSNDPTSVGVDAWEPQ